MSRINLQSFEVGYKLAQMLRTIQYEILAKPIISAELLEFERNLKQLREEIRFDTLSDFHEIEMKIEKSFFDFLVLCSTFQR
jgi:hypothetical protein